LEQIGNTVWYFHRTIGGKVHLILANGEQEVNGTTENVVPESNTANGQEKLLENNDQNQNICDKQTGI
jgi:hypothetical protein